MKLYKVDSKGKTRVLEIYAQDDKVIQKYGILGGKMITNESACVGKNIGKSNETTPQQQAVLEAESKLKKKLDEGYVDTPEEASTQEVILPMLAKDYKKEFKKVQYPCYIQPKLDGCLKSNSLIDTNRGFIEISQIVNNKMNIEVKSFNEKLNIFEYKKIINWFDNGTSKVENFNTIVTEDQDRLTCTKNHQIFTKEGWKRSDELTNNDYILKNQDKNFTGGILGIFLGDGNINKDKRYEKSYAFSFSHSVDQEEYLKHKIDFLNYNYNIIQRKSGYGSEILCCNINKLSKYYNFIESLIDEKGKRKLLTNKFLNKNLTKQGLAFWIGDDGSIAYNNSNKFTPILTISTYRYSLEQLEEFIKYFDINYNVKPSMIKDKRVEGYALTFNTKDTLYLLNLLKYNIPKGVEYKFYYNEETFNEKCEHNFIYKKVLKIIKVKGLKLKKYDIEVEDNHNYIAEGILVHNCRALKNKDILISRKGLPIETLPHISNIETPEGIYLDGELYAHGLSFQENMKLIKKNRPESVNVKYHVYDMISDLPFGRRIQLLHDAVKNVKNIELVETYIINSEEELKHFHSQFIQEGYEGTMVRWGTEGYQMDKRSSNLLKYKDFIDEVATIVDVIPSEKRPEHAQFICEMNGKTFGCGMKFSHADRVEMLENKEEYIGQKCELRFFEYTDGNLPRFPTAYGIRIDR